jgi:uncharacterized RDD family membrane protein YckC
MANAAPFIAKPSRRLCAGLVDVVAVAMSAGMVSTIAQTVVSNSHEIELALIVYALYHTALYLLWGGQTLGLRLFDIRAVSAVGNIELSLRQGLARAGFRPLLLYVLGWVSYLIAPHQFNVVAAIVLAPLLGELGMMFSLPSRQTLSDIVSRTLVVSVPPPQPHRAPAAPMYSAKDAEFGVRPHRLR